MWVFFSSSPVHSEVGDESDESYPSVAASDGINFCLRW